MRTFNRLASLVLALLLIGAGGLLIAETGLVALGRPPLLVPLQQWYSTLTTTGFDDRFVLLTAIAVATLGLIILFAQLRPWRPIRLALPDAAGWYLQRRRLERAVAATAGRVSGVTSSKARLRHRWRLDLKAAADPGSRDDVNEAVGSELDRLDVPATRRVRLRLSRPGRVT